MRISGVRYSSRKTHKARNTILTVISLLLLVVFTLVVISAYNSWKLLHPDRKDVEVFSSNIVPEYRDINFIGSDKSIVLKGWFFQLKSSDRTVILAHSYGKNRLEFGDKSVNMIKSFLDKGYNVFTFDFRNSGQSGGDYTTMGYYEKEDLKAAVTYVSRQGSKHVVLMGFSTGAAASIMAAEDLNAEGAQGQVKVEAVIADSPYASLQDYLKKDLNRWVRLPSFPFNSTILYAMEIISGMDTVNANAAGLLRNLPPCRLLLIHGKGDNIIPVENSRELNSVYLGIAPGLSDIWETDDNGNAESYLKNPEEYMTRVFEFLDKINMK